MLLDLISEIQQRLPRFLIERPIARAQPKQEREEKNETGYGDARGAQSSLCLRH
jgi:hypothetical protein